MGHPESAIYQPDRERGGMATAPPSEMIPFETSDRRMSVLLVDDDEQMARMTATFLERELETAETTTLTNPAAAVATIEDGEYDCIVSDFDMPPLDGLELLETVRDAGIEIPFVLFTGKGSEEIASQAISAGVDEYLQKGGPEQYPVLANAVENLVEKHWAEQRVRRGYVALESAEEGIGIIDEEGVYRYVNEAYASIYGREPSELVGTDWEQLYPEPEVERFHEEILPELAAEGSWQGLSTALTSDGGRVPERLVLTQMPDGGHVCVAQDVDRRDRIEALFELTPDIVVVHDTEGTLLDVNRRACEELGYDRDELVGKSVWDVDATADADRARSFWQDLPADTPRRFEGRLERADGSTFPVEIHLIRIELNGEDRFLAIDRDITDRKAREEELVRKNERLEEFSSVVSHDLRNPLQVAQGRLELLADEVDSEHVDDIRGALDRMESLIDDLLAIAREGEEAMEFESVAIESSVREAWATVETGAASLVVDAEGEVEADRELLRQLFENLFGNAVEHAGPDCTVTVGELPDGFYVADDGPGVPAEERDRVFEPGYSTGSAGTGFGLNIVRSVVETHDWGITLTQSDDGGARFEITGAA
jgi:PAS domain S-box-containing protein